MSSLAQRFMDVKTRVGGNREKEEFEWTFGMPREEQMRITPPNRTITRILSEINFALQLSEKLNDVYAGEIDSALTLLEDDLNANGVITYKAAEAAEARLKPLEKEAKAYEVIFASHAHIDMNWMWGWQETVAATLATFRTILNLMREYPEFTFSQSQASVYKIVEDFDPEMMAEIRQRISEGRWEITATAWVETDKNMPDTESLIRHIRETRDYLKTHWGIDPDAVKVDFSPDTFGHSAFVPEINTFGGVKYYYHCRGLQDDLTLYRFRAPSGAEVLAYKEPYWYNSGVTPDVGTGVFELERRCAGLKTMLIVYGVGDHGGGPTRRDVERVLEMQAWPVFPTLRFGTIHEFFQKAEVVRENLPVVDRELNAIFSGCYTTQSRIKLGNRKSEQALLDAEKLSAIASKRLGTAYPSDQLHAAWRRVLFTHFHDILTGSCVQESREYAMAQFAEAIAQAQTTSQKALTAISQAVDTACFRSEDGDNIRFTGSEGAGAGFGLQNYSGVPNPERGAGKTRVYTVFNTSSMDKKGPVELTIWDYTVNPRRIQVVDEAGRLLRYQLLDEEYQHYWDHKYIRLLAEVEAPANSYAAIAVREAPIDHYPTHYLKSERVELPQGDVTLDNGIVRAVFSGKTGAMTSFVDLKTGAELLSGPAGLRLTEMSANNMSAWRIGRHMKSRLVEDMIRLEPMPQGELRQGFVAEYHVLDSIAKVTVTLEAGSNAVHTAFEIDWREWARPNDARPLLTYDVPMRASSDQIRMDVPAGAVVREAKAMDVPALTWASGVSNAPVPALVSDCKYGFRLSDGVLSLTLINTADNPDKYPERGIHVVNLFVLPALASAKEMKDVSGALNRQMIAVPTAVHSGALPPRGQLMGYYSDTAVLSAVFLTDEGRLALRAYETEGKDASVSFTAPFAPESARMTDLDGNTMPGDVNISGRELRFTVPAWSIRQIELS